MHKIFILTFLIIGNKLEVAAPAWCYCVGAKCGASKCCRDQNPQNMCCCCARSLVLYLKDACNKYLLYCDAEKNQ